MKKLGFAFQIFIFLWMQIAPDYLRAEEAISQTEAYVKAIPPMPKNYRLPDMHLLDTVAFYNKYKNQIGQRVDVQGFIGRFGATFGNEFKQKIYEIEKHYDEKIEIILTLSSTVEDAKILKQKMEMMGKKMVIVEIPDWLQQKILEKSAMESEKRFARLMWQTKMTLNSVTKPQTMKESAHNILKIIKNQYVKPSKQEVKIALVSATTAGTLTGLGMALSVGLDPITIATVATIMATSAGKMAFVGTTAIFGKTLGNIMKVDLINELRVMTGFRKVVADTSYAIGNNSVGAFGDYHVTNLTSDTMNILIDKAVNKEKDKRLTDKAKQNLFWYTFALGTALGLVGTVGGGGPLLIDTEYFKMSAMHGVSLSITLGMFLSYRYQSQKVNKLLEKALKERMAITLDKTIEANSKLIRTFRQPSVAVTFGPSCSLLFH